MAAVGAAYAAASAAEIASVAATAISMVASAQQMMQQQANAKAMEQAQEQRNKEVVEQTIANYGELSAVERDAQAQALDESMDVQKQYTKEKGRTNVMAAAMGIGGLSVAAQLEDLERTKYSNYGTILLSRQAKMDNIKSQAESMRRNATSSMSKQGVSRPSWAAAALNMGTAGLQGYSSFKQVQSEARMIKKPETKQMSAGG